MPRKDYDEIKEKFKVFVSTWKSRKVELLDRFIDDEIICYMSIVKAYADGSQHSRSGVKNFVIDFPKSDNMHTRICNFVCRVNGDEAMQSADVVIEAMKFDKGSNEANTFEGTAMFVTHWRKQKDKWIMDELRMDLCSHENNLDTFKENWYFDEPLAKYYDGVHFPCIQGEYDSPWKRIPDAEDLLTEEEKIQEAFAKYNFGVDNLMFNHVYDVLSEDLVAQMPPWGPMNKRHYLECLKFHRQKDRYWAHPVKVKEIDMRDDYAVLHLYRMAGHRQRNHPYVFTKKNQNIEHACGRYVLHFKKENGEWKICKWNYYLGVIELGEYTED
ncbi:MAG: nuclear transport factor 2 family protein [Eubacterium sp.]